MIQTDELNIDGHLYKLGCNLYVRLLYERMTGKMFGDQMLTEEQIIFFFAVLLTFNKDHFKMSFEEWVEYLNKHEEVFRDLLEWEVDYFRRQLPLVADSSDKKKE